MVPIVFHELHRLSIVNGMYVMYVSFLVSRGAAKHS